MLNPETGELINSDNLKVHPRMKELYKFFKYNGKLIDIKDYNPDILGVFSREILRKIEQGEEGWEDMLPEGVSNLIKEKELFNYNKPSQPVS